MAPVLRRSVGNSVGFQTHVGFQGNEIQRWDLIPFPAIHHSWKSAHRPQLPEQRRNIVLSHAARSWGRGAAQEPRRPPMGSDATQEGCCGASCAGSLPTRSSEQS